jgi:hypothetical protein
MNMAISKEDFFGRFFIAIPTTASFFIEYYNSLTQLDEVLREIDFTRLVSGYYVNGIDKRYVRVSYFTQGNEKEEPLMVFPNLLEKHGLKENVDGREKPAIKLVSEGYGESKCEATFRNYLSLETQIGLELLRADKQHARSLMATYRIPFLGMEQGAQPHFEPTFLKYSQTYRLLSPALKEQFWKEFEISSWNHMFANLIMGIDFPHYPPVTLPELNAGLFELFEDTLIIEKGWTPKIR